VEFVLELEVNQNEVVMAGAGVTAPAQSINTQARYGYPVRQSEPRRTEFIAIQAKDTTSRYLLGIITASVCINQGTFCDEQ